ncbi:hypothetical protein [Paenibacillus motobuensis]
MTGNIKIGRDLFAQPRQVSTEKSRLATGLKDSIIEDSRYVGL